MVKNSFKSAVKSWAVSVFCVDYEYAKAEIEIGSFLVVFGKINFKKVTAFSFLYFSHDKFTKNVLNKSYSAIISKKTSSCDLFG